MTRSAKEKAQLMMRGVLPYFMAITVLLNHRIINGMSFALKSSNTVRSFKNDIGKVRERPAVTTVNKRGHLLVSKLSSLKRSATQHNENDQVSIIPEVYIVVVVVALENKQFKTKEQTFLREIATNLRKANAICHLWDLKRATGSEQNVEIYCQHNEPVVKSGGKNKTRSFVSGKELVQLFSTGPMRGFLQQYNVTRYFLKTNVKAMTVKYQVTEEVWFPVAAVASATFIFMLVLVIVVCCCKKSCCESNKDAVTQLESEKHSAFVCHSVKPIETMSPTRVQPQLSELYTINGSPRKVQKWTGEREHKRPTLLQSRRGSQASLVIDLTPMGKDNLLGGPKHESPTEESLSNLSKYMTFRDLEDEKDNTKLLFKEFWAIPTNTIYRKEKQSMSNASLKNRYPDFVPNAKTAVKLKEINGDPQSSYINANFIRGYGNVSNLYIAAEGPLQSTVTDFWRMVWEQKCPIIVMITKLKEKNEEKCAEYWPSPNSKTQRTYGDITVTYDSEIERDGYTITKLYISHGKFLEESRLVSHYWFTSWPDHKVPKSPSDIISLAKDVRSAVDVSRMSKDCGPVVVHCSAGRGRTGSFIAICQGMEQVEDEQVCNILKIVSTMRLDRGGMVQKDEQYIFIHRTIYEYWKDLKSHSPSLSSILPAGIETAQEAQEDSHVDEVFQSGHFVW